MSSLTSRLVAAFVYPRAPGELLELALPLHSSTPGEIRARVVEIRPETSDISTLVLRTSKRIARRAGQYVALTAAIDGVRRTRCFSIASGEHSRDLEITIKARPGGAVTPRLVAGTFDERIVTLSQPAGDFTLPDRIPARVLLVSGGSGITPIMSMLRTLVARGHRGKIVFVHWSRTEAELPFREELSRTTLPELRVETRTSRFQLEELASCVPDYERWDTWVCGPEPLMDAVRRAFLARDAAHRVRTERFSLATAQSSSDIEPEVSFARSSRRAKGKGPLLLVAERAGLEPKSGCRMGICHTCTCRKISGVTRDLRTGALSADGDVDIQLCVSEAAGPVALDL